MRNLRLCVCLPAATTLFTLGGCHKEKEEGVKALGCDVQISSDAQGNACMVNPKIVDVHDLSQLCWQADKHDYTIRFKGPSDPTANPFRVNHGTSSPGHVIKGGKSCDHLPNGHPYCKYSVTRDNESKPCADFDDPGVHIIPGGG